MTLDNPYQPPRSPSSGPRRRQPTRSAAVTTFGILNLIYGGIGLICNPVLGVANALVKPPPGPLGNPMLDITVRSDYRTGYVIFAGLATVTCALLVGGGIGLLATKAWGRKASLTYAALSCAATIGNFIFNFVFVVNPLMELARKAKTPEETSFLYGSIGGAMGFVLIGAVYPIVLLVFMARPAVIASLTESGDGEEWAD